MLATPTDKTPEQWWQEQPRLSLLGAVELQAHGLRSNSHQAQRITELAAWLVLTATRTADRLKRDLWPNLHQPARLARLNQLCRWCGVDQDSAAWVEFGTLNHRIASDYTDWQQLTQNPQPGWITTHPKHLDNIPLDDLTAALNLVRNRPCAGIFPRSPRWHWATLTIAQTTTDITTLAQHLAKRHPLTTWRQRATTIAHHTAKHW